MSLDECPSCHAKLELGASYCPKCGKQISTVYHKHGTRFDAFINPSFVLSELDDKFESVHEEIKRIDSKLDKILEKLEKYSG